MTDLPDLPDLAAHVTESVAKQVAQDIRAEADAEAQRRHGKVALQAIAENVDRCARQIAVAVHDSRKWHQAPAYVAGRQDALLASALRNLNDLAEAFRMEAHRTDSSNIAPKQQ